MKCPYCNSSINVLSKSMNPPAGESSKCPRCGKELKLGLARGRFAFALIPLMAVGYFVLPDYFWLKIIGTGAAAAIAAFVALKAERVSET